MLMATIFFSNNVWGKHKVRVEKIHKTISIAIFIQINLLFWESEARVIKVDFIFTQRSNLRKVPYVRRDDIICFEVERATFLLLFAPLEVWQPGLDEEATGLDTIINHSWSYCLKVADRPKRGGDACPDSD
uniref:Uncharacterized protein n=1 Tax=Picea sitchensis TaxID=3332 RepID=D5ABY3_PICSI|nr:unknown [Picea sitchensis]